MVQKIKQKIVVMSMTSLVLVSCGSDKTNTSTSGTEGNKPEEVITEPTVTEAASDFGGLITELESYVGWSAVNESWKTRRDGWVEECLATTDQEEMAGLLLEFETVVNWEAVNPAWSERRESWINDCQTVATEADLNQLLAEFESYILWDAVSAEWAVVRADWQARCGVESEA